MSISLIVATTISGVIGKDNRLPWHLPEDLKFFKQTTTGHKIIMGRKTYESIGKPLPNRENIVLTQNKNFSAPGIKIVHDAKQLIMECQQSSEEIFVIGGSNIYLLCLSHADKIYQTLIHLGPGPEIEGDAYFPPFEKQFRLAKQGPILSAADSELKYQFNEWTRI